MPSRIRILNEQTINQIAAGEVIENPASIVKELVENSLDALSSEITVQIKAGGHQLIQVSDNGHGMNPDDALLCFERHATSKLQKVEDLHTLSSMGFRGEAIPSIASVSKFSLITCQNGEGAKASSVFVEGGRILKTSSTARQAGTTIEVKNLFFNVPARKKFLKSASHNTSEIHKMLLNLALGNPEVKFHLISQEKTIFSSPLYPHACPSQNLSFRIQDILGKGYHSALYPLNYQGDNCQLTGFIGNSQYTQHNRRGQYLFINKRPVSSPLVSSSISEAYGTRLPSQRHPVFVLNLSLPGELIDINVHPQKREVRFRQQQKLKNLLIEAVQRTLQQPHPQNSKILEQNLSQGHTEKPISTSNQKTIYSPSSTPKSTEKLFSMKSLPWEISSEKQDICNTIPIANLPSSLQKTEQADSPNLRLENKSPSKTFDILGTTRGYAFLKDKTFNKYDEENSGFTILDQRAAHSRIIFESLLKKDRHSSDLCIESQPLIVPIDIELPPAEALQLESKINLIEKMGIVIRPFGKNTFMIEALPHSLKTSNPRDLLSILIENLHELDHSTIFLEKQNRQLALAASHAAIEKSRLLNNEQAQALINELMLCQSPYECPRGKPTMIEFTLKDLSKQFSKKQ